jgi:hypothetical protein
MYLNRGYGYDLAANMWYHLMSDPTTYRVFGIEPNISYKIKLIGVFRWEF